MAVITTNQNIDIFNGIPLRQKFLVYNSDGSLYNISSGYLTGNIGSLYISQTLSTIEIQRSDGEIIIDLPEIITESLTVGSHDFSITHYSISAEILVTGTATVHERSAVVGGGDPWVAPIKIGTPTNYTEFEADGTVHAVGTATMFKDLLQSLIGQSLNNPGGRITLNYAEATVDFQANTLLTDYVVMPVQINHEWLLGSDLGPHVHWEQTSVSVPNWLIQYRWQIQGDNKITGWTSAAWDSNAFTYTSGTFNQITGFPDITPPLGYGEVSEIVQVRLIRDTNNSSGLFAGSDPVAGAVAASNFDLHYEIDSYGSRVHYAK